jgi:DNA-directed RNA polymerase subunit RPC12/RpoP
MKSLSEEPMGITLIVKCVKCSGLMLAAAEQKTKVCPYCGTQINVQKAKRLAAAETAMEASEMLRRLKAEKKQNPKPNRRA